MIAGRLLLFSALVVGLSAAVVGGASAQSGFQASVKGIGPKPKPCADGAFVCGSATTDYGDATWAYNPTNETPPPQGARCGSYEATVTFALGDGSTLVLDDNGTICPPPGNSLSAPGSLKSFGNPFELSGRWTVATATGAFSAIAVGTRGADALHIAGALASGTYVSG